MSSDLPLVFTLRCGQRLTSGLKCKCPRVRGRTLCRLHLTIEAKRARRGILFEAWGEAADILWGVVGVMPGRGPGPFREAMTLRLDALDATPREREQFEHFMTAEIEFWGVVQITTRILAIPAPRTDLEALVRDGQNVHTRVVNSQTAAGVEILIQTPCAVGQDTLAEIRQAWSAVPPAPRRSVLKDMTSWYTTLSCRSEGDALYRRVLDGLWTRIKLAPHKDDLVQRLWEEARESQLTCCEGHISRLCNVLVGFDDTFKAPVSTGELLQQQLAAIAGEDIPVSAKIVKASAVMDELQIPQDHRAGWLEAF
jgi:hypothetical protein